MMSEATEPPRCVCSSASPPSNSIMELRPQAPPRARPPVADAGPSRPPRPPARRGSWSRVYDRVRAPTPEPARAPAAAVLRRAAPPRRRRRPRRRRPRPRQPRGRPPAARRRGAPRRGGPAGRPRLRTLPRPPPPARGGRRPLPGRLRRRARPRAGGRARPGDEDRDRRARAVPRRAGRPRPAPGPALPRLRLRRRPRGRRPRARPPRPRGGLRPGPRRRAPGRRPLPQLPLEPVLGVRAARRVRGRRGVRAPHRRRGRPRRAYVDLVFDGRSSRSFLATPGAKEVGVEMWSMSKSYGMAGWRIGFVVGNAEIVARIDAMNDHCRVGVFAPLQEAAVAALEGPQDAVAERRAVYERRRDELVAALPEQPVCEGTFYVWLRLPDGLTVERLLDEHRVALAPGGGFGPSGEGWARASLAVPDEQLARGVERLASALAAAASAA